MKSGMCKSSAKVLQRYSTAGFTIAVFGSMVIAAHAQPNLAKPSTEKWTEQTLFDFNEKDGAILNGTPTLRSGVVYGTSFAGGKHICTWNENFNYQCGTVFALKPSGGQWTKTILHKFSGKTDGAQPIYNGLVFDAAGNAYGTAYWGGIRSIAACGSNQILGNHGCGTVFKIDTQGNFSAIYRFKGPPDANRPVGGVVIDAQGNLYGASGGGGTADQGAVYKVDAQGKETVLHSFSGYTYTAQLNPLTLAKGILYGATGVCYCDSTFGTVFKLDTSGKNFKALYSFTAGSDGLGPNQPIVDALGNIYGTAWGGGTNQYGSIWKIDSQGTFSQLYAFTDGTDGNGPYGPLLLHHGALYGTAWSGGSLNYGTVYKLDSTGTFTLLYTFTGGTDGQNPNGGVVRDANGNLYTEAEFGGRCSECGTVVELTH